MGKAQPLKTMPNEIENDDSSNVENDTEVEETEDVNALKEKLTELSGKNKQLFERAKKAEGFEKKDGKWIRVEKSESKPELKSEPPPLPKSQSNEPDYAKLAFLEQRGLKHPDEQKWAMDESERLRLPLTDILSMEHAKVKLETMKTQREALEGMPKGKGKTGGASQTDVDYWLAKGETPEDLELAEKVIDARIKKDVSNRQFDDIRV